jgi:hypothetical protein
MGRIVSHSIEAAPVAQGRDAQLGDSADAGLELSRGAGHEERIDELAALGVPGRIQIAERRVGLHLARQKMRRRGALLDRKGPGVPSRGPDVLEASQTESVVLRYEADRVLAPHSLVDGMGIADDRGVEGVVRDRRHGERASIPAESLAAQ